MKVFKLKKDPKQMIKQGGNVISYICTPHGEIVHAIPRTLSPVDYRREIEWAVSAHTEARKAAAGLRAGIERAHRRRLEEKVIPGAQRAVHTFFTGSPLPKIAAVEKKLFEQMLGQQYDPTAAIVVQEVDLLPRGRG